METMRRQIAPDAGASSDGSGGTWGRPPSSEEGTGEDVGAGHNSDQASEVERRRAAFVEAMRRTITGTVSDGSGSVVTFGASADDGSMKTFGASADDCSGKTFGASRSARGAKSKRRTSKNSAI